MLLRQGERKDAYVKVGYLSFFTEDDVEIHHLTDDDVGSFCGYWISTLGIDADDNLYFGIADNYDPDKHPNWQQILNESV